MASSATPAPHTRARTSGGLIGLLVVAGAAIVIGRTITGPLHRAVVALHGLAEDRLDQRRQLTVRDEVGVLSRAPDGPTGSARQIEFDARRPTKASDEPTTTSGTLSAGVEESATQAGVVPAATEQVSADRQTAAAAGEGTAVAEVATDAAPAGQVGARAATAGERTGTEDVARRVPAIPPDTCAAVAAVVGIPGMVAHVSDRQTPVLASLVGVRGDPGAVAYGVSAAAPRTASAASTLAVTPVGATVYAAARSRAQGPTTALWHAVELQRPVGEVDGCCELTVCGCLVRVSTEQPWPLAARDVCPACATLAH